MKAVFWGSAGFLVPGIVFTLAFPKLTLGAIFLNFFAIQVFSVSSTVVHEIGHALVAKLVEWRVFAIEVGRGKLLYEFRLCGFRWQFRGIPVGGFAHVSSPTAEWFRVKNSVIDLGGPLANAVLILAALAFSPLDDSFSGTTFDHFRPTKMLLLVNAAMFVFSLWPHTAETQYGRLPSDGLGLWRAWSRPRSQIAEVLWDYYYKEAQELRTTRQYSAAQKCVEEGLKRFPENYYLESTAAYILIELKDYAGARESYIRLLQRAGNSEELRCNALNNIAYADLQLGDAHLLAEADNYSRTSFEKMPWNTAYKATRGSVLVERGVLQEGTKLLLEALHDLNDRQGKAICACYVGVAEQMRCNLAESRKFFAIARGLDANCILLERESR